MGKDVCTACFLECARKVTNGNGSPYPCSAELRKWAAEHRSDPAGMVIEDARKEARR